MPKVRERQVIDVRVWKGSHLCANFLPEGVRYWGYEKTWYDGPIYCFGFWYFHVHVMWPVKWP